MCLYPFEHIQLYSGRRKHECHTIGVKNQSEEWEMTVLSLYLLGIGLRSPGLQKVPLPTTTPYWLLFLTLKYSQTKINISKLKQMPKQVKPFWRYHVL